MTTYRITKTPDVNSFLGKADLVLDAMAKRKLQMKLDAKIAELECAKGKLTLVLALAKPHLANKYPKLFSNLY